MPTTRRPLTPELRRLRATLAARDMWARCEDPTERTANARANGPGQLAWHMAKVDPDNLLDPTERARRAEHARKAYFARLAFKSAKARAARTSRPT